LVRLKLPPEAPWFAPISSTSLDFDTHKTTIGKHRARAVNKDLEIFGMRNGFQDFFTPHDFRRGHANFLFGRAIDMADLIAAQNNLMHTSLTTTEMYARQRQEQTRKRISIMSGRDTSIHSKEDLSSQMLLEEIIKIKQMLKKER
jgi:integrase